MVTLAKNTYAAMNGPDASCEQSAVIDLSAKSPWVGHTSGLEDGGGTWG